MALQLRTKKFNKPKSTSQLKRIAAIDFGTSSISLAYTTSKDGSIQLLKHEEESSERIPNAIQIFVNQDTGQCSIEEIGHEAQKKQMTSKNEDLVQFVYFENIKKTLMTNTTINCDTNVSSFKGGNYYLVEAIAFIIKHLKDVLLYQLKDQNLKASDFDWVITVPAIWKARARRMMREAAYLAGLTCDNGGITKFTDTSRGTLPHPLEVNPHKLTLALEPEAAAIYAHYHNSTPPTPSPHQHTPPTHIHQNRQKKTGHSLPDRYMVVDIGGTVSITVHDSKCSKIEVISDQVVSGGNAINQAFRNMIEDIVQDNGHQCFFESQDNAKSTFNKLYYQDFEEEKKTFGKKFQNTSSPTEKAAITLPQSFVNFYGEQKIAEGCQKMGIEFHTHDTLRIEYSLLEEKVFQMIIDGIIQCVRDALQQVHDGKGVDIIYLVGGFGGCSFVEKKIQEALASERGIKYNHIICPQQADLAVTIGAVMWRQDPDIIQSRIADATYGIGVAPIFDSQIHTKDYRFTDEDGIKRCHDVLEIIAIKGEEINNYVYKTHLIPAHQQDMTMVITIYATPNDDIQYIKDKHDKPLVHTIGEFTIDIANPYNEIRGNRVVDLFITFRGTEIRASARYRVTGEEVETVWNLLSYHEDNNIVTQNVTESTSFISNLFKKTKQIDTPHKISTESQCQEENRILKQQLSHQKALHQKELQQLHVLCDEFEKDKIQAIKNYQKLLPDAQHKIQQIQNESALKVKAFQEQLVLESQNKLAKKDKEIRNLQSQLILIQNEDSWKISIQDITLSDQELGRGGWGVILKGEYQRQVAIKQMHKIIISPDTLEKLNREINIMAQLRHPNLLRFIGAVFDHSSSNPMIITEVMDTSLRKAYEGKELTPDQQPVILSIMRDVAVGLNYLHSLPDPIIHRDVSSANVLLNRMGPGKWQTKISDFGSAKIAKLAKTAVPGALVYCAPECIPKEGVLDDIPTIPQTPQTDTYSYGILFCEVLHCSFIMKETFKEALNQIATVNQPLHKLIESCVQTEPHQRPSMEDVLCKLQEI